MSPYAAKKAFSIGRAARQTQYALSVGNEIKKLRAVIYGNIIRINVLLATHASETLSKTENRLATHDRDLTDGFEGTRDDMAKIIKETAELKVETIAYRDEARQDRLRSASQMQTILQKDEANSATLMQKISSLTVGIRAITNLGSSIQDLSSQILSLLRAIPVKFGNLIQTVIRSNTRIESALLSMDQKMAASPSLSLPTNIQLEDALGRIHADIPFVWFQYWEVRTFFAWRETIINHQQTFEGLLKARFKNTPGCQKVENGDFRLVHAKRPSISFNKHSWSGINPGIQIVMLLLVRDIAFRDSLCPRQSCTGEAVSEAGPGDLVTCSVCGLRFISQIIPADGTEDDDVARVQRIEDAKLFGIRAVSDEVENPSLSRHVQDITEDAEMGDLSEDIRAGPSRSQYPPTNPRGRVATHLSNELEEAVDSTPTYLQTSEPPIMSWLSQTIPPSGSDSVREWRETVEIELLELKKRETKDLETFRNVQLVTVDKVRALGQNEPPTFHSEEDEPEVGYRIYYRNILDRYPQIERPFARRLAMGNWQRHQRLTAKQGRADRASVRAKSRSTAPIRRQKRNMHRSERQAGDVVIDTEDWEDVEEEAEQSVRQEMQQDPRADYSVDDGYGLIPRTTSDELSELLRRECQTARTFFSPHTRQETSSAGDGEFCSFPLISTTKVRRFCSLPPLPILLSETNTVVGSTLCYLCHSRVRIQTKQTWR